MLLSDMAGLLLAGSTHGEHLADYMADLAAAGGIVALHEREAGADEVGKPLSAIRTGLGLRVYRGDRSFGFWEPQSTSLEQDDLIVEIISA